MSQNKFSRLDTEDLSKNVPHTCMEERLLVTCENCIRAHKIVHSLREQNIQVREHDESQDPIVGAYGPLRGISIYVFVADYEKALSIISPILSEPNEGCTFCPKCGSENVALIHKNETYISFLIYLCMFLIFLPFFYIVLPEDFGLRSSLLNKIALFMAILGIILLPIIDYYHVDYTCKHCGNRFKHRS